MKAIKYFDIFALGVYGMSFITITEDCAAPKRAYETIVPFDAKQMCYPIDNKTLPAYQVGILYYIVAKYISSLVVLLFFVIFYLEMYSKYTALLDYPQLYEV